MLTQCPGCQTVFRITGTILRAAHGQVRCGRCNTQFDAIEYLQEEEQAAQPATTTDVAATTAAEQLSTEFASAAFDQNAVQHEEITLEGNRIEISGIYRSQESASEDPIAEHTHTIIEEFNIDSEEWQNSFAEPAEEMNAEEVASAAALSRALASLDSDEDESPAQAEIVPFVAPPATRSTAGIEVEEFEVPRAAEDDEDDANENEDIEQQFGPNADKAAAKPDVDQPSSQARAPHNVNTNIDPTAKTTAEYRATPVVAELAIVRPPTAWAPESFAAVVDKPPSPLRWPWMLVSGALALLFLGQVLHHYRQTLVRHPTFGPPLEQAYELFGQTLEPRWELGAYSIKQWGIVSDPQAPGTLRVRASITNNADFAQPYPLLKLTLEDRFGANLGTREFKPEEYLSNTTSVTRRLSSNAAANVDLAIVDPGEEAIGFQFNVCVQRGNGVECTG